MDVKVTYVKCLNENCKHIWVARVSKITKCSWCQQTNVREATQEEIEKHERSRNTT